MRKSINILINLMSPNVDKDKQLSIFHLFLNSDFSVYYQNEKNASQTELVELDSINNIKNILNKNVATDFLFF